MANSGASSEQSAKSTILSKSSIYSLLRSMFKVTSDELFKEDS